jgi:hypothetical protein
MISAARIRDCASFVRSKNAGPFTITIDLFFPDSDTLDRAWRSASLSAEKIAALYGTAAETVRRFRVDEAMAIKISMPRPIVAGDVGDTDVAGGQQFLPLLNVEID